MDVRTAIKHCSSQLCALVEAREYGEGARVFKALLSRLHPMASAQVIAEFGRLGGEPALRMLVKSFSLAPCYYCESGRLSCERCGGTNTIQANGQYCEECGGHGQCVCSFCGGSGFLSFDDVPGSLVSAVLARRLTWASGTLKGVVDRARELERLAGSTRVTRDVFQRFADASRIAAVLNDAESVLASKSAAPDPSPRSRQMASLARQCRDVNARCADRLAQAIVAHCDARVRSEPDGSTERIVWERRRDYFGSLRSNRPGRG